MGSWLHHRGYRNRSGHLGAVCPLRCWCISQIAVASHCSLHHHGRLPAARPSCISGSLPSSAAGDRVRLVEFSYLPRLGHRSFGRHPPTLAGHVGCWLTIIQGRSCFAARLILALGYTCNFRNFIALGFCYSPAHDCRSGWLRRRSDPTTSQPSQPDSPTTPQTPRSRSRRTPTTPPSMHHRVRATPGRTSAAIRRR